MSASIRTSQFWDHSTFSKNRELFVAGGVAQAFFDRVLTQARQRHSLSDEHFTVDATLLEAWASLKSFCPKDDPGGLPPDDPEARLYRKGKGREAQLCYMNHALMENRQGLVVQAAATIATGTAETETAKDLPARLVEEPDAEGEPLADSRHRTMGADKGFDTEDFVGAMRDLSVTPHIAQKTKGSAIGGGTTRHPGYAINQRARKRVEEIFGWLKMVGLMRKLRHRGIDRADWMFVFACAVYNLVRIRNLATAA